MVKQPSLNNQSAFDVLTIMAGLSVWFCPG